MPWDLGDVKEALEAERLAWTGEEKEKVQQRVLMGDLLHDMVPEEEEVEEGSWGNALENPVKGFQTKEELTEKSDPLRD